jgi:hypothetical protein
MEAFRKLSNDSRPDPAWEMVRRWPGMRGEDKLAWMYVWQRSRGGRELIDITPAEIAADQNVSSDAGRQRIKNLTNAGLILIVKSQRSTGVRTLELPHPSDVSRARKIEWDGQFEFAFMDEADSFTDGESQATSRATEITAACAPACDADMDVRRFPAMAQEGPLFGNRTEVPRTAPEEPPSALRIRTEEPLLTPEEPPEVPRFDHEIAPASRTRVLPSKPSEEGFSKPSNTFETPSTSHSTLGDARGAEPPDLDRGTSGGSQPRSRSRAYRSGEREGEQAMVDEVIAAIQRKVRCPNLRLSPCVKAGKALFRGLISRHDLESLLDTTARMKRERSLRSPASAYFVGGMKKIYERYEIDEDSL